MSAEIIRRPVVAGQFYEGTKSRLDAQVGRFMRSDLPRRRAIGAMSPHAGLIYSGAVAMAVSPCFLLRIQSRIEHNKAR